MPDPLHNVTTSYETCACQVESVPRKVDLENGPFISQYGSIKNHWNGIPKFYSNGIVMVSQTKFSVSKLCKSIYGGVCIPAKMESQDCEDVSPASVIVFDAWSKDSCVFKNPRQAANHLGVTVHTVRAHLSSGEVLCKRYTMKFNAGLQGDERWVSIRDVFGMKHRYWDSVHETVIFPEQHVATSKRISNEKAALKKRKERAKREHVSKTISEMTKDQDCKLRQIYPDDYVYDSD